MREAFEKHITSKFQPGMPVMFSGPIPPKVIRGQEEYFDNQHVYHVLGITVDEQGRDIAYVGPLEAPVDEFDPDDYHDDPRYAHVVPVEFNYLHRKLD